MTFTATTRVGILRGTTTDALGDVVDNMTDSALVAILASVPASLIETSRNVYDPATGQRRTVRYMTCRLPATVAHPGTGARTPVTILEGDRVKDWSTGRIYALSEKVTVARSLAGQSSITLDLQDVTSS